MNLRIIRPHTKGQSGFALGPVIRLVIPQLSPVIINTQSPNRSDPIMTYNHFTAPYIFTLSS